VNWFGIWGSKRKSDRAEVEREKGRTDLGAALLAFKAEAEAEAEAEATFPAGFRE
jgi:hypothetical protein